MTINDSEAFQIRADIDQISRLVERAKASDTETAQALGMEALLKVTNAWGKIKDIPKVGRQQYHDELSAVAHSLLGDVFGQEP